MPSWLVRRWPWTRAEFQTGGIVEKECSRICITWTWSLLQRQWKMESELKVIYLWPNLTVEFNRISAKKWEIIYRAAGHKCNQIELCGAPPTFLRLMQSWLHNQIYQLLLVYLDDVIVFSRTFDEHLERLEKVLKSSRTKCKFFQRQVPFLGYVVIIIIGVYS